MKNVAISRMSTEAANSAECGQDESQKWDLEGPKELIFYFRNSNF